MFKANIVFFIAFLGLCYGAPKKDWWRVVGGSDAPAGAYPFMCSLRVYTNFHNCGCSLISKNTALTAAHCVDGFIPSDLSIKMGTNQLDGIGVFYNIKEIIMNPDYDWIAMKNDVALLKLEKEVELTDNIQTIELEEKYIPGDTPATLAGWGSKIVGGAAPNNLQHIDLTVIWQNDCESYHGTMLNDSEICTLTKTGEGACHGDSGSALMKNYGTKLKQIGIVCWGLPCARGYPDVYTRISSFIGWIKENMV